MVILEALSLLPNHSAMGMKMIQLFVSRLFASLLLVSAATPASRAQPLFTRIAEGPVVSSPSDSRSVNWIDVNGDGRDDLFISNGPAGGQNNALYLNQGDGTFSAVANDPIVSDSSPSDGATFADADNDGDPDAFVVTWYGHINYYYQNQGDGQFLHLPGSLTGALGTYSETAAWGDYDNDGWVDLYLTNSDGNRRNMLYHNEGNGSFTRITEGAGLDEADFSRCVNWVDYDNDGDVDLFVTNEGNQTNDLFRNEGGGQFIKITQGPLVQSQRGSMSASWGDVDNDGDLDVFIANSGNFQPQANQLFLNEGNGQFAEAANTPFASDGGCSFGSAFGDIDNDGDLDLAVANGFCSGAIVNFIYLNDGNGVFSRAVEDDLQTPCSFGLAFSDYDDDGFLDLAISTCKNAAASPQPNNILLHNNGNANHWLKVRLEGVVSNRSAIGARLMVKTSTGWQYRDVTAQSGYNGQNSLVAHFGLSAAEVADSLVVEWPSGSRSRLGPLNANQTLHLLEEAPNGVVSPAFGANWRVSPNPAKNTLSVQGELNTSVGRLRLSLIDSTGRVVWQQQWQQPGTGAFSCQAPLETLPAGMYRLLIEADKERHTLPVAIIP